MGLEKFQIKGAPTCRIVYPAGLFKKMLPKDAEDLPKNYKYNAMILVPKTDTEKSEQLMAELDKALKELQSKGFKGKTLKTINPKNTCYIDGDEWADEKEGKEAFRGFHVIKVASKNFRPLVADRKKLAILNGEMISGLDVEKISPEELKDGDYIFANISFWTYCQSSYQGIGANVHAVIRAKEGVQIGGASQDVDDYVDLTGYDNEQVDDQEF